MLHAKLTLNPHRPALPRIFLANVQSLTNKLDELKFWILTQRWLIDCNFFMETWLCNDVPNSVAATSCKSKGSGVCIYVNKTWCTDSVIVNTHCSVNLEFLIIKCRPFYLPREFTCIIAAAVYALPDANAKWP